LGDLPLALHLAGSFLKRYVRSPLGKPGAYLAALRRKGLLDHPSLQGKDVTISPTGHTAHVARTFALSLERLSSEDEVDALARSLLGRAAYFACGEPIPRALLLKTMGSIAEDPDDTHTEDALARLTDLGLVESNDEGAVVVHRLVASFARNAGSGEEDRGGVEETLLGEAREVNKSGVPGPLLVWQAHLRSVTEGAWHREDRTAADIANELGYHLWRIGDYSGARPYYERALAIDEKVLGAEHRDTAQSLNNLGVLLYSQGDLAGARPYYERALAIREKVLGAEHRETARSLNNLGALLDSQGDLAGARLCYERALAIHEKILGAEHPDTAISLNNLGFLLDSQGDLAGARPYLERALAIREKVLGAEHPNTAISLNNLGALLRSQGDLAGARLHYERALAIFEARLGPDHPDTKIVRGNLATLGDSSGS
jgi:tetratricopeptide (TPR) repeat protein